MTNEDVFADATQSSLQFSIKNMIVFLSENVDHDAIPNCKWILLELIS